MSEVARQLGVSRARVLQIEQRALAKLRRAIAEDDELREFFLEVLKTGVEDDGSE